MHPLELKAAWLKTHGRQESQLRNTLSAFFVRQADQLAAAVEKCPNPGVWLVAEIFDVQAEHRKLIAAIERPVLWSMWTAASSTLAVAAGDRDNSKSIDPFDNLPGFGFDLPSQVLSAIRQSFHTLSQQKFWLDVQTVTGIQLENIIRTGVERGANAQRIARAIRDDLGGANARMRALRIARTETTGALNAGNLAAAEDLKREGFQTIQEWSATLDSDVRPEHSALNGVRVRVGESFNVAGTKVPYPGHFSLPAAQRINCRCGCITRVVD